MPKVSLVQNKAGGSPTIQTTSKNIPPGATIVKLLSPSGGKY